ncbi:hypothetical protein E2986_14113 [Frieseomelitta varia]|uniref:Uncharacterized protein n=1 Tax=Frieseomelitta varia TaxID=561572 RepID=A0A833S834_9HYME|nr:hypothetical protein E2986_14113 [Frieseomelitta varia]
MADVTKCHGTAYQHAMGGSLQTIYELRSRRHLVTAPRT